MAKGIILIIFILGLWLVFNPDDGWFESLATHHPVETVESADDNAQASTSVDTNQPPDWQLVARVVDGDTVLLENGERVRLLGIDTPEAGECYYQEASDFLRSLVDKKMVRLEKDVSDRDQYDRLLRHLFVVGAGKVEESVNLQMVVGGYARVVEIKPDLSHRAVFKQAQFEAKEAKSGRWGECVR